MTRRVNTKFNRNRVQVRDNNKTSDRSALISVERKLNGMRFQPPADPPGFVASPWNQLTVGLRYEPLGEGNARFVLNTTDLIDDIKAQIGILLTFSMQVRVLGLSFWCNNNEDDMSRMNVDIYDLLSSGTTDNNNNILATISDLGGKKEFGRIGYHYPSTQADKVLNDAYAASIFGADMPAGTAMEVYVRVLWRPQPPSAVVDYKQQKHSLSSLRGWQKPADP